MLSENKNEYLELCAASGWQFVCAYKNMVIFLNEQENPLPLETDPEAELASIHKSFLKHDLPKTIFSFAASTIAFFYLLFSKGNVLELGLFAFFSFYIAIDFCGYIRWRKKALAAAATGKFSRTNIPDKLLSTLLVLFSLLCVATIIVKSIITSNLETLVVICAIAVVIIFNMILNKYKNKTDDNWKRNLINFVSVLIYLAVLVYGNYILDLF